MGAARPQNRTARANLVRPHGRVGGGGREIPTAAKADEVYLTIGQIVRPQRQIIWKRRTPTSCEDERGQHPATGHSSRAVGARSLCD